MSWLIYALLSAFFAALTAILSKIGLKNVDSNLATGIRVIVILFFTWLLVFFGGSYRQISMLSKNTVLFLILSGIATGLSWLFYFKALQIGNVSHVSSIDKLSLALSVILAILILKEKATLPVIIGVVLMSTGALLIGLGK